MRKILIRTTLVVVGILALAVIYVWFSFQPPASMDSFTAAPVPITLAGVTIVNPEQDRLENQRLRISGDVIEQIEAAGAGAGEEASPYRGAYVLPGLVDLHSHLPPETPMNLT